MWVSFLEPSHLFERLVIQDLILTGGKVGFHRSSLDHVSIFSLHANACIYGTTFFLFAVIG